MVNRERERSLWNPEEVPGTILGHNSNSSVLLMIQKIKIQAKKYSLHILVKRVLLILEEGPYVKTAH